MYLRLVVGTKGKHNHEDQTPTQLDGLEIMINTFLERKSVCLQPAMFEALAERHEIRRREMKSIRRQHIHIVSTILSLANDLLSCHITNIVWQFGSNNRMFSVSLVEQYEGTRSAFHAGARTYYKTAYHIAKNGPFDLCKTLTCRSTGLHLYQKVRYALQAAVKRRQQHTQHSREKQRN